MPSPPEDFLEASVSALAAEVEHVLQALRVGSIREEEDFTSQMLAGIRSGLVRVRLGGLEWDAGVLKKQSEEPKVGADFAGVLNLRLGDYNVGKAFLAQAKMAGPYKQINKKKLLEQATFMLEITPAAFVFLYRPAGISVVPAVAVVAAGGDPRSVPSWDYTTFFLEFFRCFVGDPRLAPTSDQPLVGWLEELHTRRVLEVTVRRQDH